MARKKRGLKKWSWVGGSLIAVVILAAVATPEKATRNTPVAAPEKQPLQGAGELGITTEASLDRAANGPEKVWAANTDEEIPTVEVATSLVSLSNPAAEVEVIETVEEAEIFQKEAPAYTPSEDALAALWPTPSRKWTNPDGRTVLGIVSEFDSYAETVTLRAAAGKTLENFATDKFGDLDRQYLRDASEGVLTGRAVGVHDGDSMTLLVAGNTQFKIRLEAIDAPEIGQEFGQKARDGLGEMVRGKTVEVQVTGKDKYGRLLGFVYADGDPVNHEMVDRGLAWHFVEYSNSDTFADSETKARKSKAGLWADWKPMSPWDWRELKRANDAAKRLETAPVESTFTSTQPSVTSRPVVAKEKAAGSYWLNTSGNKRHNASCRWYGNTKRGRYCSGGEGSACGI